MLHRPSVSTLLSTLAAAASQAAAQSGTLLLYVSAPGDRDGGRASLLLSPALSGVASNRLESASATSDSFRLLASDLSAFQRRPLLVVLDGPAVSQFVLPPSQFDAPSAVLYSSAEELGTGVDADGGADGFGRTGGRVLTHFLEDPVLAFCSLCGIEVMEVRTCTTLRARASTLLPMALGALCAGAAGMTVWRPLLADPTTCLLLMRFVLCRAVLKHCAPVGGTPCPQRLLPSASPPVSDAAINHPAVIQLIRELLAIPGGSWTLYSRGFAST
jgi:hypothetical protein